MSLVFNDMMMFVKMWGCKCKQKVFARDGFIPDGSNSEPDVIFWQGFCFIRHRVVRKQH